MPSKCLMERRPWREIFLGCCPSMILSRSCEQRKFGNQKQLSSVEFIGLFTWVRSVDNNWAVYNRNARLFKRQLLDVWVQKWNRSKFWISNLLPYGPCKGHVFDSCWSQDIFAGCSGNCSLHNCHDRYSITTWRTQHYDMWGTINYCNIYKKYYSRKIVLVLCIYNSD